MSKKRYGVAHEEEALWGGVGLHHFFYRFDGEGVGIGGISPVFLQVDLLEQLVGESHANTRLGIEEEDQESHKKNDESLYLRIHMV